MKQLLIWAILALPCLSQAYESPSPTFGLYPGTGTTTLVLGGPTTPWVCTVPFQVPAKLTYYVPPVTVCFSFILYYAGPALTGFPTTSGLLAVDPVTTVAIPYENACDINHGTSILGIPANLPVGLTFTVQAIAFDSSVGLAQLSNPLEVTVL